MGAVRLELRLSNHSEWIKIFDPRDWTVFVPTPAEDAPRDLPGDASRNGPREGLREGLREGIENGSQLRVDLDVGGWLVTLRGTVVGTREDPSGVTVALGASEREKINYLNGFVRGGLLNLREKRRLPIRLSVTYGAVEGPANTFTKDINEEGLFLFTEKPLPETSQIHMLVSVPGNPHPLSLVGKVSHTILAFDEEPPGMGIVFNLDAAQRAALVTVIEELEQALLQGMLPSPALD